jgi:serine/threonine protein kinase
MVINIVIIQGLLGEGAYGFVYAGVDKSTNERVAIKVTELLTVQHLIATITPIKLI